MRHFPLPCIAAIATLTLISTPMKPFSATTDAYPSLSPYTEFVRKSCANTTYPDVCYETLSSCVATELENTALSVSLNGVQSASDVLTNLSKRIDLSKRKSRTVVDCMEVARDSVDELRQSLVAMRDLQGPEFEMQMSNIQTWVSAALTNEDTCMDCFMVSKGPGKGKMKGIIRSNVVRVAQLTSNALALVNRLSQ